MPMPIHRQRDLVGLGYGPAQRLCAQTLHFYLADFLGVRGGGGALSDMTIPDDSGYLDGSRIQFDSCG